MEPLMTTIPYMNSAKAPIKFKTSTKFVITEIQGPKNELRGTGSSTKKKGSAECTAFLKSVWMRNYSQSVANAPSRINRSLTEVVPSPLRSVGQGFAVVNSQVPSSMRASML